MGGGRKMLQPLHNKSKFTDLGRCHMKCQRPEMARKRFNECAFRRTVRSS